MFHCKIYSKEYLEDDSGWSVTPTTSLLQRIHAIPEQSSRWIAALRHAGQDNKIALGSPIQSEECALYFPVWFIDAVGILPDGGERIVRFEVSERIPRASKLHFKTLGIIPDWVDIVSILEEPLSQLGVLKRGQMVPVPVIEDAMLILDTCEPDEEFVFMDGSDITLEVDVDDSIPVEQADVEDDVEADADQHEEAEEAQQDELPIQTPPLKGKFVPFQGKGYVLGGR
jgi:hypothetical protein